VLLLFNTLLALAYRLAPAALTRVRRPPTPLAVVGLTIVAFVPLRLAGSHFWWVSAGPFDAQPIRLGLYLAYFGLGVALGSGRQGRPADWPRRWGLWLLVGLFFFVVYLVLVGGTFWLAPLVGRGVEGLAFALSCAGLSLGLLGAFGRLVRAGRPLPDGLSANAYGIYLVHYACVTWLQFALLPVAWPAGLKFGAVLAGALALSWGTSWLLRRIPPLRRVL
jgi:glucan biosynthesis protein C